MTTVIELRGVHKTYPTHPPVHALRGVDFSVRAGERVAVVGPSGAGKSTLLNILGLLDRPTKGRYTLLGQDARAVTGALRDQWRATALGFVFQENHILGHRTVAENVELKLAIAGTPFTDRPARISGALERVGLSHREHSLGRLLSGGEKQRLAVARAMVASPQVLLADEPTGNLDSGNAHNLLDIFEELAAAGVAVVVITHDLRLTGWADRTVHLVDGCTEGCHS